MIERKKERKKAARPAAGTYTVPEYDIYNSVCGF